MNNISRLAKQAISELPQHRYEQGKTWYQYVNGIATAIGNGDTLLGAAIIAALSPQIPFKENIRLAFEVIEGKRSGHYSALIKKAAQLIELASAGQLTEEAAKRTLNGPKISAFFENIYRPETSEAVTIDVWMIRFLEPTFKHMTPKRYRNIESELSKAAKNMGLKPHQLQAICWIYVRGEAF